MLGQSLFAVWSLLAFFMSSALCKTVKMNVTLTWETVNPNGIERKGVLINGVSPGPPLVLDQYDNVEFLVHNSMPNSTTVHFHGITQLSTPWSDGVPGLSQRPIPSGESFFYRWTADESGTYWYHSHYRSQIMDGAYGPILIRPAAGTPDPFSMITTDSAELCKIREAVADPRLVMVSDWSRYTSDQFFAAEAASNLDITCLDSILINGKGGIHCPGLPALKKLESPPLQGVLNGSSITDQGCVPVIPVIQGNYQHNVSNVPPGLLSGCHATKGKQEIFTIDPASQWASFNFISAASIQAPLMTLDNHTMFVYEVDGRYVEPYPVQGLQILNGERYAVLVKLNQTAGDYTLRAINSGLNQIIAGYATVSYVGGAKNVTSTPYYNYGAANLTETAVLLNTSNLLGFPNVKPPQEADQTHIFNIDRAGHSWTWEMSTESYGMARTDQRPLLWHPESAAANDTKLAVKTVNGSVVDLVFQLAPSKRAPLQPPHPIHKHSNKASFIGVGSGPFKWSTVAEAQKEVPQFFNLETPLYRDSFTTPPLATQDVVWIVVRYHVINPGAFFLHCHIQTHLAGGFAAVLMDGYDVWPQIPAAYGPAGDGGL